MLQIKTIRETNPETFDEKVNAALADGWALTRRLTHADFGCFVAELEREVITEAERCCENCRYWEQDGGEPCDSCVEFSAWEDPRQ